MARPLEKATVGRPFFGSPDRRLEGLRPMIGAVVGRVLSLPRSHADVEDGISETFRRLVEGIDRVRPGEPVGPWAAGIARHVAVDQLRARKRARLFDRSGSDRDGEDGAAFESIDPAPGPEELAMGAEETACVKRALATMNDAHRDALLAFHVDGLAYQEISAKMGVPMGTVATWISRARKTVMLAVEEARTDRREESR